MGTAPRLGGGLRLRSPPLTLKLRGDANPSAYDRLSEELDAAIARRFGLVVPVKLLSGEESHRAAPTTWGSSSKPRLLPNGIVGIETKTPLSDADRAALSPLDDPLSPQDAERVSRVAHARLLRPEPRYARPQLSRCPSCASRDVPMAWAMAVVGVVWPAALDHARLCIAIRTVTTTSTTEHRIQSNSSSNAGSEVESARHEAILPVPYR
ncbi:MAG: hypothetical protein JWR83_2784 [Aeromicrobium sp.]|nr:hypothetical protein [Aeromicrobium sp.]